MKDSSEDRQRVAERETQCLDLTSLLMIVRLDLWVCILELP